MKKSYLIILIALISLCSCSSTQNSTMNDGLTRETAIKVNSVQEEYKILPKLCPDCKLKSQGVGSQGNKHYDSMTMIKPNGETVVYYFDITSFYGKF